MRRGGAGGERDALRPALELGHVGGPEILRDRDAVLHAARRGCAVHEARGPASDGAHVVGAGGEHVVGQCGQDRGRRVRGLEDRRDGRPAVLEHGALDRRLQLGVAGHQCPGLEDLGVGGVQRARERVQLVGGRLQRAGGEQRRGGPLLERDVRLGAGRRVQDDRAAGGQARGGGQTLEHVSHLARRRVPALA